MVAVMRALLLLCLALASVSAHAEPVSTFIGGIYTWLGTAAVGTMTWGSVITAALTVVSVASTMHATSQQKRRARQEAAHKLQQDIANLADRRLTLLQSDSPHAVVYGSPARVGGAIVGMVTTGAGAQWTHIVMIFAAHPCEAIEELYIDDDPIQAGPDGWTTNETFFKQPGGFMDYDHGPMVHVGVHLSPGGVDVADQWLIDQCNSAIGGAPGMWTADHKLSGFTYAVVSVNKIMDRFQGGPPNVTAKLRGKASILDVRTGERGYSRNPALCLADFITSEQGYGASWDQIDTAALIAAANACDEEVYGADADDGSEGAAVNFGGSRALYVCDGMFRSDQDRDSTRQQLEEAMAGFSMQSGGVWRIQAGAWSTPVLVLGDADMLQPSVVVQTGNPGERVYNTARGTYVNAAQNGVSSDFAQYQNETFLALDPHAKILDMALPFTGAHVRCHQLARVAVERSRGGLVLQIFPKMLAWHLQPGDRVLLSSAFLGFEDKAFIVTDWRYSRTAPLTLEVQEDVPAFYDTADEVLADAAPNSNLPNPYAPPAPPQNLRVESGPEQIVQQVAGAMVRARVSWAPSTSSYVIHGGRVRVQWRAGATDPGQVDGLDVAAWNDVELPGDAVETFLLGLDVGSVYSVRARFETTFTASAWVYAGHTLEGNTGNPAEVQGLALWVAEDGIRARWGAPVGLDQLEWDGTQVRRGDTWPAAAADVRFDGRALTASLGWFPAGAQNVWAAHRSMTGRWSSPISAGIAILPPATVVPQFELTMQFVQLRWADCRTTQPISRYVVRKGEAWETADPVGQAVGTSFSLQGQVGAARYWVAAVDVAGNLGVPGAVDVTVDQLIESALDVLDKQLGDAFELLQQDLTDTNRSWAQAVAAEAQNRAQAIIAAAQQSAADLAAEAQAQAAAITAAVAAEAQRNTQALAAEAAQRAQALAAEAAARAGDVGAAAAAEAQARAAAIAQEAQSRAAALGAEAVARNAAIQQSAAALQASIDSVHAQLGDILGVGDYDPAHAYAVGEMAKAEGKLYRSTAATQGNPPPDAAFWQLVGNYASIGEAVAGIAAQVQDHSTRIQQTEDAFTAQAAQLSGVASRLGAAEGVGAANAGAVSGLQSDVSSINGALTAQAQRLDRQQAALDGKASASALAATDAKVTQAEGAISSHSGQLASLGSRIGAAEGVGSANAGAISGLQSDVSSINGTLTSQSRSIVSLTSELQTGLAQLDTDGGVPVFRQAMQPVVTGVKRNLFDYNSSGRGGLWYGFNGLTWLDPNELAPDGSSGGVMKVTVAQEQILRVAKDGHEGGAPGMAYAYGLWIRTADGSSKQLVIDVNDRYLGADGVVTVDGTYRRITAAMTTEADTFRFMDVNLTPGSYYVFGAQIEVGSQATAYQAVETPTNFAGSGLPVGSLWVDTANNNRLSRYNGAGWDEVTDARIGPTASAVQSLEAKTQQQDGQISSHSGQLVSLGNRIGAAEGVGAANAGAVLGLQSDVSSINGALTAQAQRQDQQQAALDGKASASALAATDAKVTQAEGTISSHSGQLVSLGNRIGAAEGVGAANAGAVSGLQSDVSSINGALTAQAQRLDQQQAALDGKASASVLAATDAKVTQAEGAISSHSGQLASLGSRIGAAEGVGSANAGAISGLQSDVSSINGALSSQSRSIVSLSSELQTGLAQLDADGGVPVFRQSSQPAITGIKRNLLNGNSSGRAHPWDYFVGDWTIDPSESAPDGSGLGVMKVTTSSKTEFRVSAGFYYEGTPGETYTYSVFIRSADGLPKPLLLDLNDADWSDGGVPVIDGGYRRVVATGVTSANGYRFMDLQLPAGSYYLFGAQIEVGSQATAYQDVVSPTNFAGSGLPVGSLWVDTANNNRLSRYNGAGWDEVTDARIGPTATAVQSLEAKTQQQDGQISSHSGQLVSLGNRIGAAEGVGSANAGAVSGLQSDVGSINGALTAQAQRLDHQQAALDGKASASALAATDAKVTQAEGAISSHSGQLASLGSRIGAAEGVGSANAGAVSGLQSDVGSINGALTAQAQRLDQQQAALDGKASASALAATDAKVTQAEGTISSHSGQLVSLGNRIGAAEGVGAANAGAVSGLQSDVGSINGALTAQAQRLDQQQAAIDGKASASALAATDAKVTQAEGAISSHSGQLASLGSRIGAAEGVGSVNAGAISGLQSDVGNINGALSSQSRSIVLLTSELRTGLAQVGADGGVPVFRQGRQPTVTGVKRNLFDVNSSGRAGPWHSVGAASWVVDANEQAPDGSGPGVLKVTMAVADVVRVAVGRYDDGVPDVSYSYSLWIRTADGSQKALAVDVNDVFFGDDGVHQLGPAYQRISATLATNWNYYRFLDLNLPAGSYYLFGAQIEVGSQATAYQDVVSPTNFAGSGLPVGSLWVDTANNNRLSRYNGAGWDEVTDARIGPTASAVQSLEAKTQQQDGQISSHSGQLVSLGNRIGAAEGVGSANAGAVSGLQSDVSSINGALTAQAQRLDQQQAALDGKASASALAATDAKVTQAEGTISSHSGQLASLGSRIGSAEGVGSANAGAISGLQSDVSSINGTLTSQSRSLVSLTSELQTGLAQLDTDGGVPVFRQATQPAMRGVKRNLFDYNSSGRGGMWYGFGGATWLDPNERAPDGSAGGVMKVTADQERILRVAKDGHDGGTPGLSYAYGLWIRTADGTSKQLVIDVNDRYLGADGVVTVDGTYRRITAAMTTEADTFRFMDVNLTPGSYYVFGAQIEVGSQATAYQAVETPTNFAGSGLPVGALWVDTANNNRLSRYNGAGWDEVTDARIGPTASAVQSLEAKTQQHDGQLSAQAASVTALQARADGVDGKTASIEQSLSVTADTAGKALARYTFRLDVGGRISGMLNDNDGQTSRMAFLTDVFSITSPGYADKPVFTIGTVGGTGALGFRGDMYLDGSILARSISVQQLAALTANLGQVYTGRLDVMGGINGEGGENWGYARSYGKWYGDGQWGWLLARRGSDGQVMAEINGPNMGLQMHGPSGWMRLWGPGFNLDTGGLTINQVDVIDTLNVRGGAINTSLAAVGADYVQVNFAVPAGQNWRVACHATNQHAGPVFSLLRTHSGNYAMAADSGSQNLLRMWDLGPGSYGVQISAQDLWRGGYANGGSDWGPPPYSPNGQVVNLVLHICKKA